MADPLTSMVGTVVSGLVKVVLGKLSSAVYAELAQIYGVKSELRKLENTLNAINALLQDAEEKQYNNESISLWLVNLKDVVYDIVDLLDLVSTRVLESKVNVKNPFRRFSGLYSRHCLTQQVKEICRQLDEINEDQQKYHLRGHQSNSDMTGGSSADERETCSSFQESEVSGREEDKESIVSRLVSPSSPKNDKFLVIPIIGMGGIGKTTLAKLVSNDHRVAKKFNLRIWTYVSMKYDLKNVIRDIIQCVIVRPDISDPPYIPRGLDLSMLSLEALKNMLHKILTRRTFLLVLDDVWIKNFDQWEKLKELLVVGSGSAILVTTREEYIASFTGTIEEAYRVKPLPDSDCWSIFVKCAFQENEEKDKAYQELEKIGKSIIKKCVGVPLAVKTLGSLLRNKRNIDTWKKIEESELWRIDHGPNGILPALKLSFDHTPSHLRACFAYCAIFSKRYPLHRDDLINLWMAQGLLDDQDGTEEMRDVGDKYFDELVSRSFFQFPGYAVVEKYVMEAAGVFSWHSDWDNLAQSFKNNMISNVDTVTKLFTDYRGKLPFVEMHDLMQDLAVYVAGKEIASVSSSSCKVSLKTRHLTWDKEDLSEKQFPTDLLTASKARTFAILHPMGSLTKSFLEKLLSNFKCLRVLVLCGTEFEELPSLIGDVKPLRYLDVSVNSKLKLLPDATCKLVNLQVLDFGHCNSLKRLPKHMHRLVSLRSLIVTSNTTLLPKKGFQCWSSLRILKMMKCPNLASLPEGIGGLGNLRIFGIEKCSSLTSLPDDMNQLTNLQELSIAHCQLLDLAEWKGLQGLQNLKYLRLYGIPKLEEFPFGLESASRSLQLLRIGDCNELRSLPESLQNCTSLLKFQVYSCNVSTLPKGIKDLTGLQELTIAGCPSLSKRCQREIGDDWHLISHIPYIHIDHQIIQSRVASTQD